MIDVGVREKLPKWVENRLDSYTSTPGGVLPGLFHRVVIIQGLQDIVEITRVAWDIFSERTGRYPFWTFASLRTGDEALFRVVARIYSENWVTSVNKAITTLYSHAICASCLQRFQNASHAGVE